ncbi:MAG: hypothetical protein EOO77_04650 [Oxalobacteraceae bacterium]|nr:MAG: hypothetical protein EOO77_04650 [Oxalobacteraceae bacterium]
MRSNSGQVRMSGHFGQRTFSEPKGAKARLGVKVLQDISDLVLVDKIDELYLKMNHLVGVC